MAAFSLTLTIFGFWTLIGWALVVPLNGGRNLIRNALLAPIAGAATVVLAVFECNHLGIAVQVCGPVLTVLMGAVAAASIWHFRFPVPWRKLAPFLGVIGVGALLVGYPLLLLGFDWFSYGNDDMANYVLGAGGFLKHGYLNSFDPRLILENRDMEITWWLRIVFSGVRCGCEIMLAWVMSLTGLNGHQIFMPVIVALHLTLICAAGALIARGRKSRLAALVTCALVAASSLVALGTVYQLIAQVFGLGLLAGTASVLIEPSRGETRRVVMKRALLAGLFCSAIGVTYPEILPFLILTFGLTHALALWRRHETMASLARSMGVTLGAAVVLLNTFADSVPRFLFHQAGAGLTTTSLAEILFPYYLLPSGLAVFWGFVPIAQPMARPMLDIAIVVGAILLAAAAFAVIWQAWRGQPAAMIALVMLVLAIRLAWVRSDFGLYKLAMYSQPFVLGSMVLAWLGRQSKTARGGTRRAMALVLPLAMLAALGLKAELHYVGVSAGRAQGRATFVEVPEASAGRLNSRLQALGREPHRPLVVFETSNVVLAKVETTHFSPSIQEYPAEDYFTPGGEFPTRLDTLYANLVRPGYFERTRDALMRWHDQQRDENFDMLGGTANPFVRVAGRESEDADYSLVASGPLLSPLNRSQRSDHATGSLVSLMASEQVRNRLIQVNSELGANYYHSGKARAEGRIAMFQLEPDYFFPGRTMSGVGRVILFEVLHPTRGMRLEMEYTASLQSDGSNTIPPAQAIGRQRTSLNATGRGSARLFSPPLDPQMIGGRYYVAIDMGAQGRLFPQKRSGLMRWYGTSVSLDSRRITGFLRDVSAIDSEQYDQLPAPTQVSHFPADLDNKALEYSGIYEDSWLAEESFLQLRQPARRAQLSIRAMVPPLGQKPTRLHVFVDGSPVAEAALHPGDNEVTAMLDGPVARRRVDLHFDSVAALPGSDGRLVSAQLKYVGFTEDSGKTDEIAQPPISIGQHWYPYEKFGGQTFRWVENDAGFSIPAPRQQSGELAIDLEPGPGMGGKPLALRLMLPNGGTRVLAAVTGRQTLRVPLTLDRGVNRLSLRCVGGGMAIPSDPRKLNFRVFTLAWQPK